MKNRSITYLLLFGICSMLAIMQSCQKTDDLEADINSLKDRVAALEKQRKAEYFICQSASPYAKKQNHYRNYSD